MTIAKRLKSERKAQGACIWEFAEKAGIRAKAQSDYERGSRSPRADYLNVLHHLDMDVPYILLGIRTKHMSTYRQKTIH
ncbi:helix-turn-helix domain-containing protein [Xanthomonas arboricola]|uniref:helix-turn-helix domain-containing protein n=1 Tax=Xanthomonas arboricola TaxID=56448 RepID=UPI0025AF13F7|nr:helix-turn-helix transcriptional regulator [Xanthomonas arboricola]MDN0208265.1 helix-turn-helix transcriptional regulator [Xanthomonas arboricola pv. corylina]MDN0212581.1 helix-turn-helix transcriptional regulator [Xanthomonas arboricola pv. corylina]